MGFPLMNPRETEDIFEKLLRVGTTQSTLTWTAPLGLAVLV